MKSSRSERIAYAAMPIIYLFALAMNYWGAYA